VVILEKGGALFEGKRYRSLTAFVKAITGSHWSVSEFFGLNGKRTHRVDPYRVQFAKGHGYAIPSWHQKNIPRDLAPVGLLGVDGKKVPNRTPDPCGRENLPAT
jgi:hypothetical protein